MNECILKHANCVLKMNNLPLNLDVYEMARLLKIKEYIVLLRIELTFRPHNRFECMKKGHEKKIKRHVFNAHNRLPFCPQSPSLNVCKLFFFCILSFQMCLLKFR